MSRSFGLFFDLNKRARVAYLRDFGRLSFNWRFLKRLDYRNILVYKDLHM
jgi:hypothetical protein